MRAQPPGSEQERDPKRRVSRSVSWCAPALLALADRPGHPPTPPPPWWVIVGSVLFGVSGAVLAWVLGRIGDRRMAKRLAAWLAEQRYDVVEQRLAEYPYGPYRMRARWSSKFVVRVRLPSGEEKTAWICMNNFFAWGGKGTPEVQWDP